MTLQSMGFDGIIIALISGLIYYFLNKKIESKFNKELESYKHKLELEHSKLSIVYENQKESFKKVIQAMHRAIKEIELKYNIEEEGFDPIDEKAIDEFKKAFIEESLFLSEECEKALFLFANIMGEAVWWPQDDSPDDITIRRSWNQMLFISERIREYFRLEIGISSESASLFDVDVLGACRLINHFGFSEANFPTESILKIKKYQSTSELVTLAKENIEILESELVRFVDYLKSDPQDKQFFYEAFIEAERYLLEVRKHLH